MGGVWPRYTGPWCFCFVRWCQGVPLVSLQGLPLASLGENRPGHSSHRGLQYGSWVVRRDGGVLPRQAALILPLECWVRCGDIEIPPEEHTLVAVTR